VTTSLRDVQAVLLSLFTDRTILMGHSLESDLTAVKVFVISYPHEILESITSLNFYIFGCEFSLFRSKQLVS
jgi:hypothetical protein